MTSSHAGDYQQWHANATSGHQLIPGNVTFYPTWTYYPYWPYQAAPQPCPTCGHCPTCGRDKQTEVTWTSAANDTSLQNG